MGQLKISQLPEGTTPDGNEYLPAIQNGKTVKISASQLGGNNPAIGYPAADSLSQNDIGKLVSWSKNGAVVGEVTGAQPGTLGQWRLTVEKLPDLPVQREIYFDFSAATIGDGQNFGFTGVKAGDSFHFRTTPIGPRDVALGETTAQTLANLVAQVAMYPMGDTLQYLAVGATGNILTVKTYPSSTNWVGGQSMFEFSHSVPGVVRSENKWTDGVLSEMGNFQSVQLFSLYDKVHFSDIFSKTRTNGYLFAGYRFPETVAQYRDNIRDAHAGYWWYLAWSDSGTSECIISQNEFRESEVQLYLQNPYSSAFGTFYFQTDQKNQLPMAGSVPGHLLGRLVSVSQEKAYVDPSATLKVKLAGNVEFDKTSPRALVPNRLGMLYANGQVIPLTAAPEYMQALDDEGYRNGIQLFEFLEEGNTGDEVYARTMTLVGGK